MKWKECTSCGGSFIVFPGPVCALCVKYLRPPIVPEIQKPVLAPVEELKTDRSLDVREALDIVHKQSDQIDAVVILCLRKDGSQMLQTSNCTGREKAFLLQYFQAWMGKWFFDEV